MRLSKCVHTKPRHSVRSLFASSARYLKFLSLPVLIILQRYWLQHPFSLCTSICEPTHRCHGNSIRLANIPRVLHFPINMQHVACEFTASSFGIQLQVLINTGITVTTYLQNNDFDRSGKLQGWKNMISV